MPVPLYSSQTHTAGRPLVPPWNESKMAIFNSPGTSQTHSSFEFNGSSNPKFPSFGFHNDVAPLFQATTAPQFSSSPRWPASSVDVRQTDQSHKNLNTAIPSQQQATISLSSEQERKWLYSLELTKFKSVNIGNKQLPVTEITTMLPRYKSPHAMLMNPYLTSVNQSEQQHSLIAPLNSLSLKVNLASSFKYI